MAKDKKKNQKLSSFDALGGMVFSTNPDWEPETGGEQEESLDPKDQNLEVHREKKGRGGKTVIILRNFQGSLEEMEDLGRDLKKYCSCGGSVKDGEIIIQGDLRPKVCQFLDKKGYAYKKVGG